MKINPLNAELNPFCHLLVLVGAHHILHVSRVRVNHSDYRVLYYKSVSIELPYKILYV
jgi:hypothetical protein